MKKIYAFLLAMCLITTSVMAFVQITKPQVYYDYCNVVDVNDDNMVNILDMSLVKSKFGRPNTCNEANQFCEGAEIGRAHV